MRRMSKKLMMDLVTRWVLIGTIVSFLELIRLYEGRTLGLWYENWEGFIKIDGGCSP